MNNQEVSTAYVGSTEIKEARLGTQLVLAPGGDALWYKANEIPTLDLRFADNKSLVDATTGNNLVTFSRASDATYVDSQGVIRTALNNEPRFDHNPSTGESLGLLVEEARTNLLLRSAEFDNASWTKSGLLAFGSGSTANATTAPNGTLTADLLTESTAVNAERNCYQSGFTSTPATLSCYIKPNGRNFAGLRFYAASGDWVRVTFALTGSGTASSVSAGTSSTYTATIASIVLVGNGWYRVSLTAARTGGISFAVIDFATSASPTLSATSGTEFYTGDGTSGIYLWGAQLEVGAFPTSYIPTTTAAVTRAADVASIDGTNFSSWYNQSEGTVFSSFSIPTTATTGGARVYNINNAAATSQIWLRLQGGTNRLYEVTNASVVQASLSAGTLAANTLYKGAAGLKANDFAFSDNGSLPITDASGSLGTVDRLGIGMDASGIAPLNGHIRRLVYWGQRLPNSVLQAITQ